MHQEIVQWVQYVKGLWPEAFTNVRVLDVGALDINGSNRRFFVQSNFEQQGPGSKALASLDALPATALSSSKDIGSHALALEQPDTLTAFSSVKRYIGLDLAPGPNVDVCCRCQDYGAPDDSFDTVISTDALEHDMHYTESLRKMWQLLRPGGLLILTCATSGRSEHGTLARDSAASPLTQAYSSEPQWASYYKNLTLQDLNNVLPLDLCFSRFEISIIVGALENWGKDLRFWGIKKVPVSSGSINRVGEGVRYES